MRVLVDTSVLSLAFRRRRATVLAPAEQAVVDRVGELARIDGAVVIGMVRQEALSGLRTDGDLDRIRTVLDGLASVPTDVADYDAAAQAFNRCRARGIAAGPVDMLLCATAVRYQLPILTVDADFVRYATVLPIRLDDPTS